MSSVIAQILAATPIKCPRTVQEEAVHVDAHLEVTAAVKTPEATTRGSQVRHAVPKGMVMEASGLGKATKVVETRCWKGGPMLRWQDPRKFGRLPGRLLIRPPPP